MRNSFISQNFRELDKNAVVLMMRQFCLNCSPIIYNTSFSDINECAPNGVLGPCAQICTNTPGSFKCSCKAGYTVSGYACNGLMLCICAICISVHACKGGTFWNNHILHGGSGACWKRKEWLTLS